MLLLPACARPASKRMAFSRVLFWVACHRRHCGGWCATPLPRPRAGGERSTASWCAVRVLLDEVGTAQPRLAWCATHSLTRTPRGVVAAMAALPDAATPRLRGTGQRRARTCTCTCMAWPAGGLHTCTPFATATATATAVGAGLRFRSACSGRRRSSSRTCTTTACTSMSRCRPGTCRPSAPSTARTLRASATRNPPCACDGRYPADTPQAV